MYAFLSFGSAAPAFAETACIAARDVAFFAPGGPADAVPLGQLAPRECYTVLDRTGSRAKLWIPKATGFAAEVEVAESSLALVLVGDVVLQDSSGATWGKVLSGALVAVESASADRVRVITVEGRARVRFDVSVDDLFPASSWPEPDPEISPDKGWPTAPSALPASGTQLLGPGGAVRAEIQPTLFAVRDLLLDPDFGQLRAADVSKDGGPGALRIAGPSAWFDGVSADPEWLASRTTDTFAARPSVGLVVAGDRQIATKPAGLYDTAKGKKLGELSPGHWLRITEEQGGWARVSAGFTGGTVEGWVEKQRLISVKKTPPPPAPKPAKLLASFGLGRSAVQWVEPESHEEEEVPALSLTPIGEALAADVESLRLAYARILAADPGVAGELTLRLLVAPSGELLSTHVAVDKLANQALQEDLLARFATVEFEGRKLSRAARRSKVNQDLEVWVQVVFSSAGPE
jgi:hypothetical protein